MTEVYMAMAWIRRPPGLPAHHSPHMTHAAAAPATVSMDGYHTAHHREIEFRRFFVEKRYARSSKDVCT